MTTQDTTTDTAELARTVDAYLQALTEADPDRRAQLIRQAWVEDGHFVDPLLDLTGHDAIDGIAPLVHEHYPGHTFRRSTGIDAHHDRARFGFEMVGPDGAVALHGTDVLHLAADGRIQTVNGFYGDIPAE